MPNPASVAAAATISAGTVVAAAAAFEVFVFRPWRQENWPDGIRAGLKREFDEIRDALWELRDPAHQHSYEQGYRPQQPHVPGVTPRRRLDSNDSTEERARRRHVPLDPFSGTELFDRDTYVSDQQRALQAEMEGIEMQQRRRVENVMANAGTATGADASGVEALARSEQTMRARQPWTSEEAEASNAIGQQQSTAAPLVDVSDEPALSEYASAGTPSMPPSDMAARMSPPVSMPGISSRASTVRCDSFSLLDEQSGAEDDQQQHNSQVQLVFPRPFSPVRSTAASEASLVPVSTPARSETGAGSDSGSEWVALDEDLSERGH